MNWQIDEQKTEHELVMAAYGKGASLEGQILLMTPMFFSD